MHDINSLLLHINKKIEKGIIRYGLVLAILFLVLSIPFIHHYYPEKWIEASGVIIALISLFVMVAIMFMNNQTVEINTQRQIDTFKQQTQSQIDAFKEQIDKQIDSFQKQTNEIIGGLERVNASQEEFVKVSLIQTESFIRQTNLIKEGLEEVSWNVQNVHHVSKENTNQIVRTLDYNQPVGTILIKGVGELVENIGGKIHDLWKKITS